MITLKQWEQFYNEVVASLGGRHILAGLVSRFREVTTQEIYDTLKKERGE